MIVNKVEARSSKATRTAKAAAEQPSNREDLVVPGIYYGERTALDREVSRNGGCGNGSNWFRISQNKYNICRLYMIKYSQVYIFHNLF